MKRKRSIRVTTIAVLLALVAGLGLPLSFGSSVLADGGGMGPNCNSPAVTGHKIGSGFILEDPVTGNFVDGVTREVLYTPEEWAAKTRAEMGDDLYEAYKNNKNPDAVFAAINAKTGFIRFYGPNAPAYQNMSIDALRAMGIPVVTPCDVSKEKINCPPEGGDNEDEEKVVIPAPKPPIYSKEKITTDYKEDEPCGVTTTDKRTRRVMGDVKEETYTFKGIEAFWHELQPTILKNRDSLSESEKKAWDSIHHPQIVPETTTEFGDYLQTFAGHFGAEDASDIFAPKADYGDEIGSATAVEYTFGSNQKGTGKGGNSLPISTDWSSSHSGRVGTSQRMDNFSGDLDNLKRLAEASQDTSSHPEVMVGLDEDNVKGFTKGGFFNYTKYDRWIEITVTRRFQIYNIMEDNRRTYPKADTSVTYDAPDPNYSFGTGSCGPLTHEEVCAEITNHKVCVKPKNYYDLPKWDRECKEWLSLIHI